MHLLGLDIGTSGAKAGLFDLAGNLVALAQEEYHFSHPQPGWSEIDPNMVWDKLCHVTATCISRSGLDPREVGGLGLSVIGETAFPVDETGQPVYAAIESMDQRADAYQAYVARFREHFDAETIYGRTSYPLNSLPPPAKIMWLREHRPEVYARARHFVTFQDFAIWQLTGQPAIDYSMASRTMLFDVRAKRWIPEFLEVVGVPEGYFSPASVSSHVVGTLTKTAAEKLSLVPGIPVVPGAHDQSCAALGVGLVREGLAADGTGSVEAIATATHNPFAAPELLAQGVGSQCHVTPDLYLALGFHLAAGSLVRWYRDTLGLWEMEQARRNGQDAYDLITAVAQESPPGARGLLVLPHWSGAGTGRVPALNPASRGAILGLTLGHTRADLSRAVFEGITYEARFLLEALESAGITISEMVVTGGGARSPFWLQLKADITGRRIAVPRVTEASLLGAALLAGVGAGAFANVETAVDQVCETIRVFEPNPDVRPAYERAYAVYRDTYAPLLPLASRLAA
jgi:xylulokinase